MKLTNFNIDLRNENFQPVMAFSTNQNAFLLLAKFEVEIHDNTATIPRVKFQLEHLNNDVKYNVINDIVYKETLDEQGPAFFIFLKISDTPKFNAEPEDLSTPLKIELGAGKIIRFHLDYTEPHDPQIINSGDWPCNSGYVI